MSAARKLLRRHQGKTQLVAGDCMGDTGYNSRVHRGDSCSSAIGEAGVPFVGRGSSGRGTPSNTRQGVSRARAAVGGRARMAGLLVGGKGAASAAPASLKFPVNLKAADALLDAWQQENHQQQQQLEEGEEGEEDQAHGVCDSGKPKGGSGTQAHVGAAAMGPAEEDVGHCSVGCFKKQSGREALTFPVYVGPKAGELVPKHQEVAAKEDGARSKEGSAANCAGVELPLGVAAAALSRGKVGDCAASNAGRKREVGLQPPEQQRPELQLPRPQAPKEQLPGHSGWGEMQGCSSHTDAGRGGKASAAAAGSVVAGPAAVHAADWVMAAEAYLEGVEAEGERAEREWELVEGMAEQGLVGARPCMVERQHGSR